MTTITLATVLALSPVLASYAEAQQTRPFVSSSRNQTTNALIYVGLGVLVSVGIVWLFFDNNSYAGTGVSSPKPEGLESSKGQRREGDILVPVPNKVNYQRDVESFPIDNLFEDFEPYASFDQEIDDFQTGIRYKVHW